MFGIAAVTGCSDDEVCDPDAPNTICTIAGSGEQGSTIAEGPALAAALYIPIDLAVSPDGELWVLDFNNYVVRAIGTDGRLRTVIGSGDVGDSPAEGTTQTPALAATFNHTTDLVFHDGALYLAAWHNSRVKRVRLADMMLENVAGRGRRTYYDGDGGPALEATLDVPSGLAFDSNGNLAVMDQNNQVVRKIDRDGMIHRIAGMCVADDNHACAPDQVPTPCPDSNRVTCGDPALTCTTMCAPSFAGDGGSALEARLSQGVGQTDPTGHLAYDGQDRLVIADTNNHRLRRIDGNGVITTIAGTGVAGYDGDGGLAINASLARPFDIEIGSDGTIYFSDPPNNCIRKIDPAGTISRVAGLCGQPRGFSGDGGSPLDAELDRPYGIELAGDKLYVADSYNNRVRVVNLAR